jgi:hypothetical protein
MLLHAAEQQALQAAERPSSEALRAATGLKLKLVLLQLSPSWHHRHIHW